MQISKVQKVRYKDKTKEQLLQELAYLKQRLAELGESEAERERIEKSLREEENYRVIFSHAQDGIVLTDSETGYVVDCNPKFENQTGRKLEQLKQMKIGEVSPPEKILADKKKFLKINENGFGRPVELEFQKPDGEIVPVELISRKIVIRGKQYFLGIARDITERKQAEEALKDSEEFSASLLRSSPTPIFVFNPDTSARYINKALEDFTGFTAEEIVGIKPPYPWWTFSPEEGMYLVKESMRKGRHRAERLFQKKNGQRFWVELSATPVKQARKLKYLLVTWVDITERKRVEMELKEYRGHLEELVEKRTAELTEVNKKLEQQITERKRVEKERGVLYKKEKKLRHELELQMKQRVEFTRALVHELKTPLTALLAAGDLLAADIKDEPYASLVSNIQRGTSNLDERINELLDLARGEIGMLRLKCRSLDLPECRKLEIRLLLWVQSRKPETLVSRDSNCVENRVSVNYVG